MTFGTYDALKAAIGAWLRRPGDATLTAQVGDFIALAEVNLNTLLRLRAMETEQALNAVVGSRFVPAPDHFLEPIACWYAGVEPRQALVNRLPEGLPVTATAGTPSFWAVDGSQIAFERPADTAFPFALRYLKGFALSDAEPTNWLLTNYPNLYLYGALKETAPFLKNDTRIATWDGLFQQALERVEAKEARSRSLAPLATEVAGMMAGRGGYSIFEG